MSRVGTKNAPGDDDIKSMKLSLIVSEEDM